MQLQILREEGEDTSVLEEEMRRHKAKASEAQNLLRDLKDDPDDRRSIICIDLQQTLPCPRLTTGAAFYLRKLWVYNFCVFNVKTEEATMFIWDETQGGRGADEIASCLHKWLDMECEKEDVDFNELTIIADNCAGQNKNKFQVAAALQRVHSKCFSRI